MAAPVHYSVAYHYLRFTASQNCAVDELLQELCLLDRNWNPLTYNEIWNLSPEAILTHLDQAMSRFDDSYFFSANETCSVKYKTSFGPMLDLLKGLANVGNRVAKPEREPLVTFELFPRLPVEIRDHIWIHALPDPRTIELFLWNDHIQAAKEVHAEIFRLRRSCKDAKRTIELAGYTDIHLAQIELLGGYQYESKLLYHPGKDTIFLNDDVYAKMTTDRKRAPRNPTLKSFFENVQSIAFGSGRYPDIDPDFTHFLNSLKENFRSLKLVTYVEIPHSDRSQKLIGLPIVLDAYNGHPSQNLIESAFPKFDTEIATPVKDSDLQFLRSRDEVSVLVARAVRIGMRPRLLSKLFGEHIEEMRRVYHETMDEDGPVFDDDSNTEESSQ